MLMLPIVFPAMDGEFPAFRGRRRSKISLPFCESGLTSKFLFGTIHLSRSPLGPGPMRVLVLDGHGGRDFLFELEPPIGPKVPHKVICLFPLVAPTRPKGS